MRFSNEPVDPKVWPSRLPAGARWLPYPVESHQRPARTFEPQPLPPPTQPGTSPRQTFPTGFWRFLVVAALGAGLVGVGGGMLAGFIFGVH